MTLRPYQLALVERLLSSDKRRSAIVLPTGGGKTAVMAEVIRRWPGPTVFLCDRQELADQALAHFGESAGLMIGGQYRPGNPTVCGVFTAVRKAPVPGATLVLVDECHLAAARTWRTVIDFYPEARVIGATATCYRYGGGSLADLFDETIAGPSTPDLIRDGYLCPVRTFASREDVACAARVRGGEFVAEDLDRLMRGQVMRHAVDEWAKLARDKRTIAFATSKAHAHELGAEMRWYGPGEVICEDTPKEARRTARQRLAGGSLRWLVSIDTLGIGFDCPPVECGLMCRPTLSRGVFRQQAGRIMRMAPGKAGALLLDMAGNVARHGLPQSADIVDLNGQVVPIPKRGTLVGLSNCRKCLCVFESNLPTCPECGSEKAPAKRIVRTVAGTLDEVVGIEATGAQEWAQRATPEARASWIRKKLSNGWSQKQIAAVHKRMFGTWPDWGVFSAA